MRWREIYDYIFFGTALRYLLDVQSGWPIHGDDHVLANLHHFFDCLDEFGLPVTKESTWELRRVQDDLRKTEPGASLTQEQADELRRVLVYVRHTLYAEAGLVRAYLLTEKRIDVKKLVDDVGSLMAPDVFELLPPMAQLDLEEAGKCIAFERPTAAAFHVLRATEDVLREFYRQVIRQKRLKDPGWASMLTQMRSKKTNRPDDALLDVLDRIRINYRNPTAHPDAVYDIHDAQELFLACVEAIGRMANSHYWKH